jgi:dTDP-glucose 4,6-dehydratase
MEGFLNILVTGGAGFIGSCFVRMALQGKLAIKNIDSVTVLDSLTYSGNISNLAEVESDSRFTFVLGSITDRSILRKCLTDKQIVINFAAESHVDRSIQDAESFIQTNIVGSYTLFDECLTLQTPKILHVSTDEVYGSISKGKATEEYNLIPNSPYSASKASSDLLARSYFKTHDLPIIITRCANNYGQYQYPEKLIPLFITNLIEGKTLPLYGTGKNIREWIHVEDHCLAISIAVEHGEIGEIYNISGGISLENIEIARIITSQMGFDDSVIKFVDDRLGHDKRYAIDDSKIRNLGFNEKITFTLGIKETIAWYEKNDVWWRSLKEFK